MIIGMRVETLNPKTDKTKHINSCYFTMAAKKEDDKLIEVPGLIIENKLQLRRYAEEKELRTTSLKKSKC